MRHARADYSRIQDPAGLIPEDEPVFLLRAQDYCALKTLSTWIEEAQRVGVDRHMIQSAIDQHERFTSWRLQHGVKSPDMPLEKAQ